MNSPKHFREILQSELAARLRKNPRYSLRAFARDLNLSPARLSEILNHRKGLSREGAMEIALKLGMNPNEREMFCDLVQKEHARSKAGKLAASSRVKAHEARQKTGVNEDPSLAPYSLTLDSFRLIEDWYHLAILQVFKIKNSIRTENGIAKQFGISPHLVKDAIARLIRLELLEMKSGKLCATDGWVMSGGTLPSASIKKFHEQILERAGQALYQVPHDQRTFRSSVLSINPKRLSEIEDKIKAFSDSLIAEYNEYEEGAETIALSIQAFPFRSSFGGHSL